ncbi:hypothetical protein EB1_05270 [Empedobacter brevis NBRC 14943 = ATCC 43319]|uniref:Uncharacterized protein n=1 Tax=Empedobacter brevis NBRC 14943 = ATCC 43319 TaxID=1218108 RepID=A0A511NDR6_9FLAO|nr:hypothetical protein [Empedobacter brevis]GEM50737.1 hypothetical protein EB1_05270 [Empedobacter brevis NBRC 14943 = ATCC 43319]
MQFDPTFNYGDTDLTNDDNLIRWKFGELIKNLVTLSSQAERQTEIIGIGATCDEMAIDFDTYFTLEYHEYLKSGLLTSSQVEKLKELDRYFEKRSGDKSPDFWDDFLLETSSEWQDVRQMAKAILETLNMQDFTIEFYRTEKYEKTNKGKRLIMQTTKTRLIKT